jgi:hypothetical protein
MAKVGRPKSVEDAIDVLATLKRTEIEHARTDHRLGSELGRLYKRGTIDAVHFLAGEAIAALAERYKRLKGIPLGRPKPNQLQPRSPGTSNEDYDADHVRDVERRFDLVFHAMSAREAAVVYDVCVNNEFCAYWEIANLKNGLKVAATRLRLD